MPILDRFKKLERDKALHPTEVQDQATDEDEEGTGVAGSAVPHPHKKTFDPRRKV
jgi:hypothetical protein